MTMPERELRLLETFVWLLPDHQKDFEGFVRDVENVRYCHTPIDNQQLGRCEYALRNMELRILTIHNCIKAGIFRDEKLDELVSTKNDWLGMKERVDTYLRDIQKILQETTAALRKLADLDS